MKATQVVYLSMQVPGDVGTIQAWLNNHTDIAILNIIVNITDVYIFYQ
jgi:hypothetical protein